LSNRLAVAGVERALSLPRLFRPISSTSPPEDQLPRDVVAALDVETNVLRINTELFTQLLPHQQRQVEATTEPVVLATQVW
jgi:hypothetical protein